jgi:integrase/recombinase XerD
MSHQVTFELASHQGKPVILIKFEYSPELIKRVKHLKGVRWSQSKKVWYVSDTPQYRQKFGLEAKPLGEYVMQNIRPVNELALRMLIETLQLKGYSLSTIRTYQNEFAQLLYVLKDKKVDELDAIKLRSYFLYCVNTLKLSENTLHSRLNAVKFYFEQVLKREKIFYEIPRPKKPSVLPKVISAEDIKKIFELGVCLIILKYLKINELRLLFWTKFKPICISGLINKVDYVVI